MNLGEVFTALGFVVGGCVFLALNKSSELDRNQSLTLASIGGLFGIVSAKVVQALLQSQLQAAIDPAAGGRSIFAGVIGGWIAIEVAKRRMGIKTPTGDAFAPALALGEAVGRIGCLFNSCCYGKASSLPWSIFQHGEYRHPAQVYSALASVLVFVLLMGLRKRKPYPGALFHAYLALWGLGRFVVEFFRESKPIALGLDMMQFVALETVIFGTLALVMKSRLNRNASTT